MPIDLNTDLGTTGDSRSGDDAELAGVVTSANVPCGAHAGDPVAMQNACAAIAAAGLGLGALVGYRDPFGKGERFVDYSADDLTAEIVYQLGALDGIALTEGTRISHIRPAGALFRAAQTDRHHAWAIVNAVLDYDTSLIVVGLAGSALLVSAERHGLCVAVEAQPHRLPRSGGELGARITEQPQIVDRALAAAAAGDATTLRMPTGDRGLARAIRDALVADGHTLARLGG